MENITVTAESLAALMLAATRLGQNKKLKSALHMKLSSCVLSDECCTMLLKPARPVSLVVLKGCKFNNALFDIKFNVKQHIQIDKSA